MIIFKKIRWKNFLSTGNAFTEIDLIESKTTLIVGKNGAGKSTLADAISYVLFNKSFRKINKPQLVNSINKKELIVEIEFTTGSMNYKVVRGMRPGIFEIFQNDILLNQSASTKDYQEVLEKQILKMNHKTFCQVVILGSASFVPFMQLAAGQRREITEDVLDLQIFSIMNSILKEKINNNSSMIKECDFDIKLTEQRLQLQQEHLDNIKKDTTEIINNLKNDISEHLDSIKNIIAEIESKENKKTELLASISEDPTKISSKISKFENIQNQLISKIKSLDSEILFYSNHDKCPTCRQEISESFKHDCLDKKNNLHNQSQTALTKLAKDIKILTDKLKDITNIYDECSEINMSINVKRNTIKLLESKIQECKKQIKILKDKIDKNTQLNSINIDIIIEEHNSLVEKKKNILLERELYGTASTILKDNGIKSKIIKQYVPIINKYINKYLAAMNFFVSFELDENFNETIKSRQRDDFSYSSFSEGEKSRINLAILFTWRTIAKLRNSASCNILIFDEIFDGSLDGDGTEEFMKILETAAPESNVFVISHKTDAMLDRFDRVIEFTKVKNFSEVV